MLLLTNCTDASHEEEFNDWFDNAYLTHVSASGTFHHATRYRNTEEKLSPSEARYMTLLETDSDDLSASMQQYHDIVLASLLIMEVCTPQWRSCLQRS